MDGPITVEVSCPDAPGMIAEAQELMKLTDKALIKIPLGNEGLKARIKFVGHYIIPEWDDMVNARCRFFTWNPTASVIMTPTRDCTRDLVLAFFSPTYGHQVKLIVDSA